MNLQQIARALGGKVNGLQVIAPGPGHSKEDRSLVVFLDPYDPDLFRVHSHAGDDWKTCRDYVKARLGLTEGDKRERPGEMPRRAPVAARVEDDAKTRTIRALTIWGEAQPIDGTPVLTYLAKRSVDLGKLPSLRHALRWHPACPWEQSKHGAMVALMTDTITGEPRAVHRTAITGAGEKVGKKMLGPSAGCLVRLWADENVTTGLVIAEGIETALVAATRIEHRGTVLAPAWAACSAATMAKFPVLAGIECLTLLVDHDESGTGERAALEASERWTSAGREVVRLKPAALGADFADLGSEAA